MYYYQYHYLIIIIVILLLLLLSQRRGSLSYIFEENYNYDFSKEHFKGTLLVNDEVVRPNSR